MNKDDLRNMLQAQTQEFSKTRDVVLYAGLPNPERKNRRPRSVNYREDAYKEYVAGLQS